MNVYSIRCNKCLEKVSKRDYNFEQKSCWECSNPEQYKEQKEDRELRTVLNI